MVREKTINRNKQELKIPHDFTQTSTAYFFCGKYAMRHLFITVSLCSSNRDFPPAKLRRAGVPLCENKSHKDTRARLVAAKQK